MRRDHIVSINILQPQSATNSKMCFSDKINFLVLLIGESKKLTSHLFYKSFLMNFQSQNWPPYCSRPINKWVNGAGWLMTSSREPIRHYHIISEKAATLLNYRIMTEGVLLHLFVLFCFILLCFVLLCLFVCLFFIYALIFIVQPVTCFCTCSFIYSFACLLIHSSTVICHPIHLKYMLETEMKAIVSRNVPLSFIKNNMQPTTSSI